jgi:formylglycine-generating enzyme required for sulfatase activity
MTSTPRIMNWETIPSPDGETRLDIMDAPVTVYQYEPFVEEHPDHTPEDWKEQQKHAFCPVVGVSYHSAQAFAEWVGDGARLPTEEEWLHAAKADEELPSDEDIDAYAWSSRNSPENMPAVRQLKPNAWGLHDMLGLVWEWTSTPWSKK